MIRIYLSSIMMARHFMDILPAIPRIARVTTLQQRKS
tara:strand:- start:471 stop:581 length:111 start_codon:yes stop_codon:yes gene_type:complete